MVLYEERQNLGVAFSVGGVGYGTSRQRGITTNNSEAIALTALEHQNENAAAKVYFTKDFALFTGLVTNLLI